MKKPKIVAFSTLFIILLSIISLANMIGNGADINQPTHWWMFNSSTDDCRGEIRWTQYGNPDFIEGDTRFGNGTISFNSGDYLRNNSFPNSWNNATFSFWLRNVTKTEKDTTYIFYQDQSSGYGQYSIIVDYTKEEIRFTGQVQTCGVDSSIITKSHLPNDGLWHHIAFALGTSGDANITVYIDGVYKNISDEDCSWTVTRSSSTAYMASENYGGSFTTSSGFQLNDFRIYINQFLNETNISQIYQQKLSPAIILPVNLSYPTGALSLSTPINFSWTHIDNGSDKLYDLNINGTKYCENINDLNCTLSYNVLPANGNYIWNVTASNYTNSSISTTLTFDIKNTPILPANLTYPILNSKVSNSTPINFSWTHIDNGSDKLYDLNINGTKYCENINDLNCTLSGFEIGNYYIWNVTSANSSFSIVSITYAFSFNYPPIANDVEINNTPIALNDANCSGSMSDLNNDSQSAQETLWFVNGELNETATNKSTLFAGNYSAGDNLTCSIRYFDSIDWSSWLNSSVVVVGDASPPTIFLTETNVGSITTTETIRVYMNVTDAASLLGVQTLEYENQIGVKTNFSMALFSGVNVAGNSVRYNYNLSGLSIGTHYLKFFSRDSSGNIVNTSDRNLSFAVTVVPAGSSSSSGGGGGGDTTIIQQIINESIYVPFCGDGICNATIGEDIFGCPSDCFDTLDASYLTCSAYPMKPCIWRSSSNIAAIIVLVGIGAFLIVIYGDSAVSKFSSRRWMKRKF